ncbi:MAG TPA: ATP-binding cassette domain-containing protein [Nocardioides sp.]|nr:ATP-binding cassette domain-containing protein [Nocardioides sp.]
MITVDRLTKTYGGFTAVDDVSFTCRPGTVTGFLGPNGAGKTTTMRVMTGLTPATRGRVTIGGLHYHDIPNPGRHVGVLLDASAQHAGRTGREILVLGARTMGLPKGRVDEMLALVGLTDTEAGRRLRNYSLGMRQRLGIAHALLGDPSVLILDEPANGLDPAGIRWMRGLLKSYADRGGTVLLSSHLLHEVEQIADEMILIGHGRIVAQGDRKSLLANASQAAVTLVTSLDNAALSAALSQRGHQVEQAGDGLKVHVAAEEVGRAALEAGVVLTDLRSGAGGLEDLFLELTSATAREAVPGVPPPQPPSHGAHLPPIDNMPPVDSPTQTGGHPR